MCGPQQFIKFSNRFNFISMQFLQHFREFSSNFTDFYLLKNFFTTDVKCFNDLLLFYQKKIQRFIQNQINSNDQSRYIQAMFTLCEQFGGLGMFNLASRDSPVI